jgi:hypothetical protein
MKTGLSHEGKNIGSCMFEERALRRIFGPIREEVM